MRRPARRELWIVQRTSGQAQRGRPRPLETATSPARLAHALALIVAARTLRTRHAGIVHVHLAGDGLSLTRPLSSTTMTRHAAFAAGFPRFLARPLVGRPLLMGGLAALAGNLTLL